MSGRGGVEGIRSALAGKTAKIKLKHDKKERGKYVRFLEHNFKAFKKMLQKPQLKYEGVGYKTPQSNT